MISIGVLNRVTTVMGLLTASLGLIGCNRNMPVNLRYSPLAATESLTMTDSRSRRVLVVGFQDLRADKKIVGHVNDAFGGHAQEVTSDTKLEPFMAEALTDALRKAGLDANLESDRLSGAPIPPQELTGFDFVFGGRIKQLDCESQPGWATVSCKGRVVIDVMVTRADRTEWLGPIEGVSEKADVMALHTQALSEAIDIAIQDCMRNAVRHIKSSGIMQGG